MIPTWRLWVLLALGVPLGAAAYTFGQPWLLMVYNLVLLLGAVVTWHLAPDFRKLRIERLFDPVLSVRVPNRITLEFHNEGVMGIEGRYRDEPPAGFDVEQNEGTIAVGPGRVVERTYTVVPDARGGDFFRGTFLRIQCPLRLVERQVRLRTEQPVRVYPNVLALKEFDLLKQKGKLNQIGIRKSRARGLGMEFESLREYSLGDDYRKIDWKASARKGALVVRQFDQERNQAVIVCIDVGRRMLSEIEGVSKLDHVLDACIMLTHAVVNAGDLIGLLVYSDRVRRYLPPRKGRAQVGAIIEALHDLVAEPVESDPVSAFGYLASRWKRRSLVVCFADVEDPDDADVFSRAFGPIARRHLGLLGRVSDPQLKELAEGRIGQPRDLYLKASALFFVDERRHAGATLAARDIHYLDAEPQELAASLVSFYFEVKERSLLA